MNRITRPTTARLRQSLVTARTRREAERRLALDLGAFTSRADLLELAAICDRYDDAVSEPIRDSVDWTRAA